MKTKTRPIAAKSTQKVTRKKIAKKIAKKITQKIIQKKRREAPKESNQKIDELLLSLPHSGLSKISKSLSKIKNFSADLIEKEGMVGILGRAVLLRAKSIRDSLRRQTKSAPRLKKFRAK